MRAQRKLQAPLPLHEVRHLQHLALTAASAVPKKTEFQLKLEKEESEKRQRTGKFQGFFHVMSTRFLRRRYRQLLDQYIPVITHDEEQQRWKIEQAVNPVGNNYPPLPERHLKGFKFSINEERGIVDSYGKYINEKGSRESTPTSIGNGEKQDVPV